jgi:hypothetical protein
MLSTRGPDKVESLVNKSWQFSRRLLATFISNNRWQLLSEKYNLLCLIYSYRLQLRLARLCKFVRVDESATTYYPS